MLIRKYFIPQPAGLLYVKSLTAEEAIESMDKKVGDNLPCINVDFEAMARDGWVGLEISLSEYGDLYWLLYGWDCESIVVFSPDQIELVD